jgi:hypothetical protein
MAKGQSAEKAIKDIQRKTRVLFEIDDAVRSMRHWNKGMGTRDEEPLAAARRLVRALEEFEKLGRTAAEISARR